MQPIAWLLWTISICVVAIMLGLEWKKTYRNSPEAQKRILSILFFLLIIALSIIVVNLINTQETMNSTSNFPWSKVGLLFIAMIFGMISQYFYYHGFNKINWSGFSKPFFASPIIFIPLISAYQNSITNMTSFQLGDLMILLVAFQNGFFWKMIFERQEQQISEP